MAIHFVHDVMIVTPSDPTLEEPKSIDGMARELRQAIRIGARKIIVDLDKTKTINADGIRAIVKAHEEAKKSDQKVCVTGLQKVDRAHSIFNLIEFVPHFDSRSAALEDLADRGV